MFATHSSPANTMWVKNMIHTSTEIIHVISGARQEAGPGPPHPHRGAMEVILTPENCTVLSTPGRGYQLGEKEQTNRFPLPPPTPSTPTPTPGILPLGNLSWG